MRRLLLLASLLTFTLFAATSTTYAQTSLLGAAQNSDTSAESIDHAQINKDDLKELIKTLESETARDEFLSNLKTLAEADNEINAEEKNAKPESLSEALGISHLFTGISHKYNTLLEKYELNGSIVGKILLTLAAALISAILCFITFKLSRLLRDKLTNLGTHLTNGTERFRIYARSLRYVGYILIFIAFTYSLSVIWDVTNWSLLSNEALQNIIGRTFSILLIVMIAVTVWEVLSSTLEFAMYKSTGRLGNRFRTLLPIARNVLFATFIVLFTLVIMSELGIDIMPLLAGAGIIGIAIGFGAQTLVKDFITGFIIILEDLIQIGDVVKVGDRMGLIEKITIRKVQLRDLQGIVYTIPFSDISVVENWTKDFSYYVFDIGIAYRENTDEVIGYLKEVDEDLRQDEDFKDKIIEPLEILGVDAFADSAVIIKARIKTRPIEQWNVGREFNRRMKFKFDEMGVEIPFPHQTIYFGEDKKGNAPPANLRVADMQDLLDMRQKSFKKQ